MLFSGQAYFYIPNVPFDFTNIKPEFSKLLSRPATSSVGHGEHCHPVATVASDHLFLLVGICSFSRNKSVLSPNFRLSQSNLYIQIIYTTFYFHTCIAISQLTIEGWYFSVTVSRFSCNTTILVCLHCQCDKINDTQNVDLILKSAIEGHYPPMMLCAKKNCGASHSCTNLVFSFFLLLFVYSSL